MRKTRGVILLLAVLSCMVMAMAQEARADSGDMGFFGGITEGVRFMKVSEEMLLQNVKNNAVADIVTAYKEIIFLGGTPTEFFGQMTIRKNGSVTDTVDVGSYKQTYTIAATPSTNPDVNLSRNIMFTVNWRRDKLLGQIVKSYEVSSWTESITVGGVTYTLDPAQSKWSISFIEHINAAVTYYSGTISKHAVYTTDGQNVVVDNNGHVYGFSSAWSKAETHRISEYINNEGEGWQMSFEIRPSVTAYKTLQYHENEPTLISFPGYYQEVLRSESGLAYTIYTLPSRFYGTAMEGTATLETINDFESLFTVDTTYLAGNWAHEDIRRLYALDVIERPVSPLIHYFQPDQYITRSQFIEMLVRAIRLPIEPVVVYKNNKKNTEDWTFPDVSKDRRDYPYIKAAYDAGIAVGKGGSSFCPDDLVTLEEAIYTIIKSMGLLNLGLEPTVMTAFSDDEDISDWAKKSMYAAYRIGLISQDQNGEIHAKLHLTKAAGAALINHLIEYMRTALLDDYSLHIVNVPR